MFGSFSPFYEMETELNKDLPKYRTGAEQVILGEPGRRGSRAASLAMC